MHRRGALAVLGTAALSGCTGPWIDLGGLMTDTDSQSPIDQDEGTPAGTPRSPEDLETPADRTPPSTQSAQATPVTESAPPEACADPELSHPGMSATDATPDDPVTTLAVAYNGRLQTTIDTDPDTSGCRQPPADATFLVVKFVITNTGDEPFRLTPELFVAEVKGVRYDPVAANLPFEDLDGVAISPGGTFTGWTPYWVPERAADITMVVDQAAVEEPVEVDFDRNISLNPEVPV